MSHFENAIATLFQSNDSSIVKDLKLNLKKVLSAGNLTDAEIALLTYSLSQPLKLFDFQSSAKERLISGGYKPEQIQEASELSSLMGMLNTYYKFKNFVEKDSDYAAAGLRMNALMKTQLKKEEFEMLSLAHSILNACEFCVKAHEQELRKLGLSADKIHEAVRLTSVLKAISFFK